MTAAIFPRLSAQPSSRLAASLLTSVVAHAGLRRPVPVHTSEDVPTGAQVRGNVPTRAQSSEDVPTGA